MPFLFPFSLLLVLSTFLIPTSCFFPSSLSLYVFLFFFIFLFVSLVPFCFLILTPGLYHSLLFFESLLSISFSLSLPPSFHSVLISLSPFSCNFLFLLSLTLSLFISSLSTPFSFSRHLSLLFFLTHFYVPFLLSFLMFFFSYCFTSFSFFTFLPPSFRPLLLLFLYPPLRLVLPFANTSSLLIVYSSHTVQGRRSHMLCDYHSRILVIC